MLNINNDNNGSAETLQEDGELYFKNFLTKCFKSLNPNTEFIDNWHIDYIIKHLETTLQPPTKRLIINVPPRSLKSITISVAWPAWILGTDPTKRIIVASYSKALSIKHSQDCRLIMHEEWYKKLFPATKIRKGADEKSKFVTTKNGFRMATSIGGTLTGEGADFLIVDDPHTPLQAESYNMRTRALDWFDRTFSTRLNDKKSGAIIVIMQRLHMNDLSGHLLKKGNWQHVSLPAIVDKDTKYKIGNYRYFRAAGELLNGRRENVEEIETAKLELGSYGFNSQYLQKPISDSGCIVKRVWFQRFSPPRNPIEFYEAIYQSWDCAVKTKNNSDYSVCTTWGIKDNKYYLLDVLRERIEFPELRVMVMALAVKYKVSAILIEDKSSGQALIQEFQTNTAFPIIAISPSKNKIVRLMNVSSLFEAGKVFLPFAISWLHIYEQELVNFPDAEHDDTVDSTTQFLEWMSRKYSQNAKARGM